MRAQPRSFSKILALVLIAVGGVSAVGQSLVQTHGEVVAANAQAAHPFFTAIATGNPFDHATIDVNGNVMFRAGSTAALRQLYYATPGVAVTQQIVPGQQAPGMATGILINTTATAVGGSSRLSDSGNAMWFASLLQDAGLGVTAANDTGIFGGPIGSYTLWAREGDAAPGTVGATISSSLSGLSHQPTGHNSSFRILFQTALLGGDVVASPSNNAAWYTGVPGSLELMQRKGDVVLGGAVISALGFVSQMNESGQVLHDETLSTTLGALPATAADNATLWVYTPGFGNALLVREGDAAPGTAGATFNVTSNSWFINTGASTFNAAGQAMIRADLLNGDVTVGVNDSAIYVGAVGSLTMALRRGTTPAPGTDGVFDVVNNTSQNLNNAGQIAFQATIIGGTQTAANDSGIWAGLPGSLTLVVREGDPAPGTVGATFDSPMSLAGLQLNDEGQVVFSANLLGGDTVSGVNSSAQYVWDPVFGLMLYVRSGDMIEVAPAVFKTIASFGGVQFNNGNGTALGFNNKWLVQRCTMTDGTGVIIRTRVGSLSGIPGTISELAGGIQELQVNAGSAHAGEIYAIIGSASGTTPGFTFGLFNVPLNPDGYTNFTLANANVGPYVNTLGLLDANGRATASIVIPPAVGPIAGVVVHHAYGVLDAFNNLVFVSEAARLEITP